MRLSYLLLATPLIFAVPAFAQNAPQPSGQPIGQSTKKFLDFATHGNIGEIRAGLTAEQKAQAPAVKAFARLMVLDHTELQSQLDATAALDHVTLPSKPGQTADKQMGQLSSMSGSQFDTAYINDQVQDHEKVVSRFEAEQSNAHDPSIIAVASGSLPILKQHLALAKAVQSSLKSAQTASR